MAKFLLIDEIHIAVYARKGLPEKDYEVLRNSLRERNLIRRLRRGVRSAIRRLISLENVRVRISR